MKALRLLAIAIAAAMLFGLSPTRAQDSSPAYVVSYIEVAPSGRNAARLMLRALREAARKEPGNNGFEVLQRIGQPHFAILESWADAKAQSNHAGAPARTQFRDALKPLLAAPTDERIHSGFAVNPPKLPGAAAIYAITHVDLIGAKKDEGLAALKQLSAESAKEPGNLRFDLWQQGNRPNHVTVIEAWRDKSALAAHLIAEHTRKFRDALLPMSGSLYDQRLYQAID
jgi:quinol monooxygenase YgiN